ncbi:MAG: methyl-accepting chemotaxis protein [Clostridiaceae bacterium]|nr:methyl-accepting chemotaxis protein [Clostridiaceae bacterium]
MKSIGLRIAVFFGILLIFVCLGFGIISYFASSNSLINVLNETMPKFAIEASLTIKDSIQNQLNVLNLIASSDNMRILKEADGDYSGIVPFLSNEAKRAGHLQMILIDTEGKSVSSQGTVLDMKDNNLFKTALSGKNSVSDPMFSDDGSKVVMTYAVPVVIDNQVAGVLMAVRDGLELSEFAKRIRFGKTGEAFIIDRQGRTIAHADTELLNNIITSKSVDANTSATRSARSTGTEKADTITSATYTEEESDSNFGFDNFTNVQEKMMNGVTGFEEYKYKGVAKIAGFAPISDYGWSIAVAVDKDEMMAELSNLRIIFVIISALFLAAGLIVSFLIGKNISKPLTELTNQCITMSEGNFTTDINKKYLKRNDEIGDLTRGFRKINESVSGIIKNVIAEARNVDSSVSVSGESISKLTEEIHAISSIIQELSAQMEETSAMSEEMNATTNEIEAAIESIAKKAHEGSETAGEVSKKATELRLTAEESLKSAEEIRLNNTAMLRDAIEKSKAVERIQILSDAILEIASRTNLLSLNASIEAAQAGDSGRGFVVVAEEIRKLAENSKQTAAEIQNITSQVLEAVHNLSVCSEQVLKFLDDKVAKDYDMFVETGKQYNNDAQMINNMVTEFSATSEQLYSSVQDITKAINDVANASVEGASETMDMANRASIVAAQANAVMEQANMVRESMQKLLNVVSLFRI